MSGGLCKGGGTKIQFGTQKQAGGSFCGGVGAHRKYSILEARKC